MSTSVALSSTENKHDNDEDTESFLSSSTITESLLSKTQDRTNKKCQSWNILHYLIQYYPTFIYQEKILSCITILFAIFSLIFLFGTLILVAYETGDTSNTLQFVWNRIVVMLHIILAAIDRIICLLYFAYKYNDIQSANLLQTEESKSVNTRLFVSILIWFAFMIPAVILSLNFPDYASIFDFSISYVTNVILFHIFYHIPAISAQFVMSVVMLDPYCYLSQINKSLQEIDVESNHDDLTIYMAMETKMADQRKWVDFRVLIVVLFVSTDLWLILISIFDEVYTPLFSIYMICHTVYSSIPIVEFMWSASKISSLYYNALDKAIKLRSKNRENDNIWKLLSDLIEEMKYKPMVYYLFGIQVSWIKMVNSCLVFIIGEILLILAVYISETT